MTEKDLIIQDLRRENAELRARVQEWISVKDRLPITNVGVLVYTPRLKNIFEVFYKLDGKWEIFSYRGGEILNDEVTHWMPLPEPPKEDDDGC